MVYPVVPYLRTRRYTSSVICVNYNEMLTEVRLNVGQYRCTIVLLALNAWVIMF